MIALSNVNNNDKTDWVLPETYMNMDAVEKQMTMRSSILTYLSSVGSAKIDDIIKAIGAPNRTSVLTNLQRLVATQQIYSDNSKRDPRYYRNGKLAHPMLQSNLRLLQKEYVIRTYDDQRYGKSLTITEYDITPLEETLPKAGIRIDLANLDLLVRELSKICKKIKEDPSIVEGKLIRE